MGRGQKMIHVCTTYFDPRQRCVGPLEFSAERFGVSVSNFGWNDKFDGFLRTKLIPLRKHLDSVRANMTMFVDGNDTILTSTLEAIEKTWEKISHSKVVIGSELVVWPYPELEQRQVALAGASKSPYKFVDTGLMIGTTNDLKRLLDIVIDSVPGYEETMLGTPKHILEDDVGLFVLNMLDERIDVTIDYGCEIIAPLKNTDTNDYNVVDGKLHLHLTGTTPHIVHCNGHRSEDRRRMKQVSSGLLGGVKTKVRKA